MYSVRLNGAGCQYQEFGIFEKVTFSERVRPVMLLCFLGKIPARTCGNDVVFCLRK